MQIYIVKLDFTANKEPLTGCQNSVYAHNACDAINKVCAHHKLDNDDILNAHSVCSTEKEYPLIIP